MEQDKVVNRVLRDLKLQGLISEEANGEVKIYLNAIWVASWEERNKGLADKRSIAVKQFNREGELIQEYHNVLIAARKTKYSRNTIYTSLRTGEPTRRGHIFRYADDNKDDQGI